jgi:four helix bundle protein
MKYSSEQNEERLISYASNCIKLSESLKRCIASQVLSKQFIRSSTSAALNYAESRSASSRKDFIHKLKLVAKELRETHVNLRIIKHSNLVEKESELDDLIDENNQLVAIMVAAIKTLESRTN